MKRGLSLCMALITPCLLTETAGAQAAPIAPTTEVREIIVMQPSQDTAGSYEAIINYIKSDELLTSDQYNKLLEFHKTVNQQKSNASQLFYNGKIITIDGGNIDKSVPITGGPLPPKVPIIVNPIPPREEPTREQICKKHNIVPCPKKKE